MPCPIFDVIRFVIALMTALALVCMAYELGGWLAAGLVTFLLVIAIPLQLEWEKNRRSGK